MTTATCNGMEPVPGSCPECGSPFGHNHYCPLTFREFPTLSAAREFRHLTGCGGWIFEDEKTLTAIIFPPEMTPTAIFRHPMARGRAGNLIGSA